MLNISSNSVNNKAYIYNIMNLGWLYSLFSYLSVYSFFYKITFFIKMVFYFSDKMYTSIYSKLFNYTNIFLNYSFYRLYLINDKYSYLFNYILLKKQNSFLKKKINLFNNFYSMTQKNNRLWERKVTLNYDLTYFINQYKIDADLFSNLDCQKLVDLKKKLKKTILDNRKIFRRLSFNKSTRSQHITNFISFFGKKKLWQNIHNFEFRIINILLGSGLLRSYQDGLYLLRLKGVYINRILVKNSNYIVKKGDCVELIYSKLYFLYLLKFKYICEKNIMKIRTKIWIKFKNKHSLTTHNEDNILNIYINNWLLKYSIPLYLEVDYFTLSIVVVANLKNVHELSFFFRRFFTFYLYRLYNWKWLI